MQSMVLYNYYALKINQMEGNCMMQRTSVHNNKIAKPLPTQTKSKETNKFKKSLQILLKIMFNIVDIMKIFVPTILNIDVK